jgi:histidinol-phosphate aminotransferase
MHSESDIINGFFNKNLIDSSKRLSPVVPSPRIRLNRNEAALEVEPQTKHEILNEVAQFTWKNYPPPYYNQIEDLIGAYTGIGGEQVVPSAGCANLITAILNYSAINSRQIVIARPSFSLYEFHCNTYGIRYETWWLNSQLEYDLDNLPELKSFSIVLLASPNNPAGNLIPEKDILFLLKKHPKTFFIIDEVYYEFSGTNLIPLLRNHPNIILLRSFSKSFSAAGLRIGYLLAQEKVAEQIRKLILPFSLNYLSMAYIKKALTDLSFLEKNRERINFVLKEKKRVENDLIEMDINLKKYLIKETFGNFILIIFQSEQNYLKIKKMLDMAGIELLDVSNVPLLRYSLRMTIGNEDENNAVLKVFREYTST